MDTQTKICTELGIEAKNWRATMIRLGVATKCGACEGSVWSGYTDFMGGKEVCLSCRGNKYKTVKATKKLWAEIDTLRAAMQYLRKYSPNKRSEAVLFSRSQKSPFVLGKDRLLSSFV